MNRLPRRPVTLDDVTPPRWTDEGIAPARIVLNRMRRIVDKAADRLADVADRVDRLERERRRRP
jgi:hypothetical protein